MYTLDVARGATNVSVFLEIIDDADGTPETGVLFNAAGIDLQYRRDNAAIVSVTEVTLASLTTAHTDGGFLHIANGVYRFDVPDAAFATGQDKVVIVGTVTGMIVIPVAVQLVNEIDLGTDNRVLVTTDTHTSGQTIAAVTGDTKQTADHTAGIAAIPLTAMRGTDSANTVVPLNASGVRSAVGLVSANMDAQFAASITATGFATPTNITAATGIVLSGVTHVGAVIPSVTLVETTTTNADMRGTNFSLLASNYTTSVNISTINGVTITGNGGTAPFDT